jgi:hypothetical protein
MKALSIKQPWASLIAHGIKDIENRTWKTNFRGKIYIHASAKLAAPKNRLGGLMPDNISATDLDWYEWVWNKKYPVSAIIGEVEIIDCVINHASIWADHYLTAYEFNKLTYNWVLANPVLYDKPILNVKGKLSFWEFNSGDHEN